jgi:hypothetical protein
MGLEVYMCDGEGCERRATRHRGQPIPRGWSKAKERTEIASDTFETDGTFYVMWDTLHYCHNCTRKGGKRNS